MISLPTYNFPLSFKQLIKNYLSPRSTSVNVSTPLDHTTINLKEASFLVISDDPFTCFVFGRYIEKWNGKADIASTREQAIESLCNGQYKAVLLDTKNSDIAFSSDLLKALGTKKTSVVALIDEKSETLRTSLAKTGIITDWLEKEVEPAELSQKLVFYTK